MKRFVVKNTSKETPTYFKEVFSGDERQIITTDSEAVLLVSTIPEKVWDKETALTIASLLNMGADKSGSNWETHELDYNFWLLCVKNIITKTTGSEEETNKYIDEYAEDELLFNNGISTIEEIAQEIIDFHNFIPNGWQVMI